MMSTREKKSKHAKLEEVAYQEWSNQPPIQFPLTRPKSPIFKNCSCSTSSSLVEDGDNDVEVGMDYFL